MKRSALAPTLILALLFSAVAGAQFVNLGVANVLIEERWTSPPEILLYSPLNETYNGPILLNFTITAHAGWLAGVQEFNSVHYYVDGVFLAVVDVNSNLSSPFNYSVVLKNLGDGSHILSINVSYTGWIQDMIGRNTWVPTYNISSVDVHFTLDTTPPSVSVLFLGNKTYDKYYVPLIFTVNELVPKIAYSLDGKGNVRIAGNTTLNGLSYGEHNVTVYATDIAGNIGTSSTIDFNIAEPFPTTLVVASVASAAVIGIGLLFYFKKRRRGRNP